jgi:hypothetical protein
MTSRAAAVPEYCCWPADQVAVAHGERLEHRGSLAVMPVEIGKPTRLVLTIGSP